MFDISAIICTHNPKPSYLNRVLDALRSQTFGRDHWELLLVDNISKVPLANIWDLSWHPNARHCREQELGLAAARRRGINEAVGDLMVFVDDDNVLDVNYLSEAARIARDWPTLGVWGSASIRPEFEAQPAESMRKYFSWLTLRECEIARWGNVLPCLEATPWGAGLCVRAVVARAYEAQAAKSNIPITDRKGNDLLSGGDDEFSYVARDVGFGFGTFPELKLSHLIAKERVCEEYLAKAVEGTQFSDTLIDYKWRKIVPLPQKSLWGLLSILKNLIVNRGIDRRMYLARLRGISKASRIIAGSKEGQL